MNEEQQWRELENESCCSWKKYGHTWWGPLVYGPSLSVRHTKYPVSAVALELQQIQDTNQSHYEGTGTCML